MIPPPITLQFVREETCRYQQLSDYAIDMELQHGPQVLRELPPGLQRLLLVASFDREVIAGGLWGYFAGIASDQGVVEPGPATIAAMKTFQVDEAAEILSQAMGVWTTFVDSAFSGMTFGQKRTKADIYRLRDSQDRLEQDLEPLNERYRRARARVIASINAYINAHGEEFAQPAQFTLPATRAA